MLLKLIITYNEYQIIDNIPDKYIKYCSLKNSFLAYNKDFMETQKDLAEALLNIRDKTDAIKRLEYYQTNKFK